MRILPILLLVSSSCQLIEGTPFEEGTTRMAVGATIGSVSNDVSYPSGSGLPDEDQDTDRFGIDVAYGKFLSDIVEVGGAFGYLNTEQSVSITGATGSITDKQISALGFARVYSSSEGSTRFFGEAALGLAAADREFDDGASTTGFAFDGFVYSLAAGVSAFVAEQAALEVKIQMLSASLSGDVDVDRTDVSLIAGYSIYF